MLDFNKNMECERKHNRRSTRLEDYDYAQIGMYSVTICVQGRRRLFGDIKDGEMFLNKAGKMIDKWWQKLPDKYTGIEIDEYRVMPNHVHGVINIVGAHPCVRPDKADDSDIKGRTRGSAPTPAVGTVVQWFKTMTTNEYMRNIKNNNWPAFNKRLWQRNYYDHVIRDEESLNKTREYIINNPKKWRDDEYYVGAHPCVRPDKADDSDIKGRTRGSAPTPAVGQREGK